MSTGTSNEIGYRVEARVANFVAHNPVVLADGVLSTEWRELRFERDDNPAGVPVPSFGYRSSHHLLAYEAALALAWTVVAQNAHRSIECRLVQYNLRTSHTLERNGVVEHESISEIFAHRPKIAEPPSLPEVVETPDLRG